MAAAPLPEHSEDLYSLLGLSEEASQEEIKAAYQRLAFKWHPDSNPEGGKAAHAKFAKITEAYQVLRDAGTRAQYDTLRSLGRSADFGSDSSGRRGGAWGAPGTGPWVQPYADAKDFDAAFEAWWKKMAEGFQDLQGSGEAQRERASAQRMARAAAWEWEKQQAVLNRARGERLKRRAEEARAVRHAAALRHFWQTSHGFTRQDALFVSLLLAATAGLGLVWRAHLRGAPIEAASGGSGEQQQQHRQHHQEQRQQQH